MDEFNFDAPLITPIRLRKCPRCGTAKPLRQFFVWGIPFERPSCLSCIKEYEAIIPRNAEKIAQEADKLRSQERAMGLDHDALEDEKDFMVRNDLRIYWFGADRAAKDKPLKPQRDIKWNQDKTYGEGEIEENMHVSIGVTRGDGFANIYILGAHPADADRPSRTVSTSLGSPATSDTMEDEISKMIELGINTMLVMMRGAKPIEDEISKMIELGINTVLVTTRGAKPIGEANATL